MAPSSPGSGQSWKEAALPPDVRKASGFPPQTASILPLGWKAEPSSRAEGVSQGRSFRKGEAFPHIRRQSRFGMLPFADFDASLPGWLAE